MLVTVRTQRLLLAETFTIAYSSVDSEDTVVVTLEHDGIIAYGEGAPVLDLGESAQTLVAAINNDASALLGDQPLALERIGRRLVNWVGPQGAKMALDGALHDWLGRYCDQPLWRMFGHDQLTPPTSYTLGIGSVDATVAKVEQTPGFRTYKVKVGGPDDLDRLEAVRAVTTARLRIDGNGGWTFAAARELTPRLLELGVEFVEQPFPAGDPDSYHAYRQLRERLPVLVDESVTDLRSLPDAATYADGIVVKVSRAGGIREAHRMIHAAHALGLHVMLGCMVESQLGISQAAQLASLADHIDLDGHLLLRDQPFTGLGLHDGRLVLPAAPGLGVTPAPPARS